MTKLVKDFPENIIGCKDSSYNLFESLKLPNFLVFPGSEAKLLNSLLTESETSKDENFQNLFKFMLLAIVSLNKVIF